MQLNLADDIISAIIGTVLAIVFISWFGGLLAARWADRRHETRWRNYRPIVATEVEEKVTALFTFQLVYFAGYLIEIAKKKADDISLVDYDVYRARRAEIDRGIAFVDGLIGRYHFCFRERDLALAQALTQAANRPLRMLMQRSDNPLLNFESMLTTHLQGRISLSTEIGQPINGTRHQFMLACAIAVEKVIRDNRDTEWVPALAKFTSEMNGPSPASTNPRRKSP